MTTILLFKKQTKWLILRKRLLIDRLRRSIHQPSEFTLDRSAGIATVKLPSFVPIEQIDSLSRFTHLTIQLVVVEIDFMKDRFAYHVAHSADLPPTLPAQVELKGTFPSDSRLPLLVGMGIQVHQQVNGKLYAHRVVVRRPPRKILFNCCTGVANPYND